MERFTDEQKVQLDLLEELLRQRRLEQIFRRISELPYVAVIAILSLFAAVLPLQGTSAAASAEELNNIFRRAKQIGLVIDDNQPAKAFFRPELQGGDNPPFPPGTVLFVVSNGTNIRRAPILDDSNIITSLNAHEHLTVIESETDAEGYVWYRVSTLQYPNEPAIWVREDRVGVLAPTPEAVTEPSMEGTDRPVVVPVEGTQDPHLNNYPVVPGYVGHFIATPTYTEYSVLSNLVGQYPGIFTPSFPEQLEGTQANPDTNSLMAVVRGCVEVQSTDFGAYAQQYQRPQIMCVFEVAGTQHSTLFALRIPKEMLITNVIVSGGAGGDSQLLQTPEDVASVLAQIPAYTRVHMQFNPRMIGGSGELSAFDRQVYRESMAYLLAQMAEGNAIEISNWLAQTQGVPALAQSFETARMGMPLPSAMTIFR